MAFFQKEGIRFSNLQISKIKIFQKTILSLKFKFPANYSILLSAGKLNFKFRIVFWRFEKHSALSEKSHLYKLLCKIAPQFSLLRFCEFLRGLSIFLLRSSIICMFPQLKSLDFAKVTEAEKDKAKLHIIVNNTNVKKYSV